MTTSVQRYDPIDPVAPAAERGPARAQASAEFAYDGAPGRTRREPLHVTMPGGVLKSVPAHRVVNVGSDPDLREPALTGSLHRFEDGDGLALPFVYHDPMARKFALVIPPVLRHRELVERARLLEELAADADHPIPAYVRHFAVVVGLEELAAYLALPPAPASPVEAARRVAAVEERERRLERWEAELAERERAAAEREARLRSPAEALANRARSPKPELTAADAELVDDDDVEDVSDLDGVEELSPSAEAFTGPLPTEEGDEAELVDPAEVEELSSVPPDDVTEVSESDVQPVDPDTDPASGAAGWVDSLAHALTRGPAALELARRGKADTLDALFATLGELTPDELVAVLAALCRRGELAADHLIRALLAPEPYVRHGAALALGELQVPRALPALLHVVQDEPADLWQEAARILGRFGEPAFRGLTRSFEGLEGREERFAYALAALAVQGCDGDLAALRASDDPEVAKVAREAMTLREVLRAHQEVVDGEAAADPADPVRAFSQKFQQALGGALP